MYFRALFLLALTTLSTLTSSTPTPPSASSPTLVPESPFSPADADADSPDRPMTKLSITLLSVHTLASAAALRVDLNEGQIIFHYFFNEYHRMVFWVTSLSTAIKSVRLGLLDTSTGYKFSIQKWNVHIYYGTAGQNMFRPGDMLLLRQ